jgi:hypothetical protein
VIVDGMTFDSVWESKRWRMLLRKFRAGEITGLTRQVTFRLRIKGKILFRYRADFVYFVGGRRVVEDAKGHLTREYKIKRRAMLLDHGIVIKESYEKDPSTW